MEMMDRTFEAFKKLFPYLRGALWWARDDLIQEKQDQFRRRDDRIGHPLLSLRKDPVTERYDTIPMLLGTSKQGQTKGKMHQLDCVTVVGLTKADPKRETLFGTIVCPGQYEVSLLMEDAIKRDRISVRIFDSQRPGRHKERATMSRDPWHKSKRMHRNEDKPTVSDDEMKELEEWCARHHMQEDEP